MPVWGYILLAIFGIAFVWTMAMIMTDTDHVLEPKNGDRK